MSFFAPSLILKDELFYNGANKRVRYMNRLQRVSRAFSEAQDSYDNNALIQNYVAQSLSNKILAQNSSSLGTVLEIGCGTGILSSHLIPNAKQYVLSDISYSLLCKARERVDADHVYSIVVDGEHPCFTASFDFIVSSMALEWFQDPKSALKHLVACLKPGGKLYFSTLGNNTFHEWRTAHLIEEVPCGILDFMSFGQLKDWMPLSGTRHVEEEWLKLPHENALEFLRSLKAMGAHLAHPAYKPLPYTAFKKVMEIYDRKPATTCQILYGFYQKPETVREE